MKDIVIPMRSVVREIEIYAACVVVALAINAWTIVHFKTRWRELFTTFHITLAVALIFFAALAVIRLIVCGCQRVFRRRAA